MGWTLSAVVVLAAAHCLHRLAADRAADRCCGIDRADEAAELLICTGMLAMVIPVGGPIPLAGWRAVFLAAAVALATRWLLRLRARAECGPSQCGHHALTAAAMVYMLAAPHAAHEVRDPWLTLADHGSAAGGLSLLPVAAAVLAYCAADVVRSGVKAVRAPRAPALARAATSSAMAGMLLAML